MLEATNEFFGELKAADWIQFALLIVATITLGSVAVSSRQQSRALDFGAYMALVERHSTAWRQFRNAKNEDKEYECSEILNLLEGTCHLYNGGVIGGASREMIRDYLREVISGLFANEFSKGVIEKSFSGPDTFFNIRRFALKEGLEGVPQQ